MKFKSNLKQKFLRAVVGGALVAGLLPATNAFAVSAFPTSGSCAMLVTLPVPVGAALPATTTYNIIAMLTFTSATAGTIDYNSVRVTYSNGAAVPTVAAAAAGDTGLGIAITVATANPPAPSSVKTITFTPTGGTPVTANAIAVNGGNTILIQGNNQPFSGVCQF